jgi:hypothetical protein
VCYLIEDQPMAESSPLFVKELTDQGRLQYDHPLGLCLVTAGRGNTIPLKEIFDQPETMWIQFRRRLDKLQPFCRIAGHTNQRQNTTETVGEQVQTAKTPKCTFSGVVSIDLKRFLDSGIALVECPDCARTCTLSPRKGVFRFSAHPKRKTRTPNTEQRWAMEKTIWEVVGGERK